MPLVEASTKGPSVIESILAIAVSRTSATCRQIGVCQFTLICRAWIIQEFNSSNGATVCTITCDEHLWNSTSAKMPRIPLQSSSMILQSTNYQLAHPRELKSLPFAMCNGTPQTNNREHNENQYSHEWTFNVAIERRIINFTIAVNQT